MESLKLTAIRADDEKRIPNRIEVNNRYGKYLCTIWDDDRFSFNSEIDPYVAETEVFVQLAKHFYTLFNSLIEKDEEIARLKTELNQFNNPAISRQ